MEKKTDVDTIRATDIISELQALSNPEKAVHLSRFFKTGKGEYGEGDLFMGITVPAQRAVAKKYQQAGPDALESLITSPYHEQRLTALLILTCKYEKAKDPRIRKGCIDFYTSHTAYINNWDLVDLSCYKLLGPWLEDKDRCLLYDWAICDDLWKQRIAIVTCMHFVRKGDFRDCLAIADLLLHHKHDLIHKAVGWLLRETGKKDRTVLTAFLHSRYQIMPRTMLRYAIEHFSEDERKRYLNNQVCD